MNAGDSLAGSIGHLAEIAADAVVHALPAHLEDSGELLRGGLRGRIQAGVMGAFGCSCEWSQATDGMDFADITCPIHGFVSLGGDVHDDPPHDPGS